jgi:hypothetical protein
MDTNYAEQTLIIINYIFRAKINPNRLDKGYNKNHLSSPMADQSTGWEEEEKIIAEF